jgi:hypothetical protein
MYTHGTALSSCRWRAGTHEHIAVPVHRTLHDKRSPSDNQANYLVGGQAE